jgi:hypothetical protein
LTKIFTIAVTLLILAVDGLFLLSGSETISEFLYTSSREYPVVALVAGILVGHIFWPVRIK